MSESHSTAPSPAAKPAKPYPHFPLTPHPAGYWCKKIRGKVRYFGRWDDPEGALRAYRDFVAGKPVQKPDRAQSEGTGKPSKPRPDFPLYAHRAGQWAKKIRGRTVYFGPWGDPEGALTKYLAEKDALQAGRKPRPDTEGLTVKDACNDFLNAKQALVDAGELSPRTWDEYKAMADELVAHAGKTRLVSDLDPEDFAGLRNRLTKKWGPHRVRKAIQYVRSIFKHAVDAGLIDRPVRFGPGFKRPSMKTLRLHRAAQGAKLFTAEEVRQLIDAAGTPLKTMILLGINAGFGNADCGNLPLAAIDLNTGWIDYPRPKTGIPRRCPLWPETVRAIQEALAVRPEPKNGEHAGLTFITKYGDTWGKDTNDNPIAKETAKLLKALGINGRKGLGFYTLRHTFRTIADEARDQPAADFIMGHEVPHMSSVYRETISGARLRAVTDHVRAWLFLSEKVKAPAGRETGDRTEEE
jgi:integrase